MKCCQYHTGHLLAFRKTAIKALKAQSLFKPIKCTTKIDFSLASVFCINLEHLSHPTLVLLFTLWKGKYRLKVRRELFCQNNTVMLTYRHNHAPKILLGMCSCYRNEKQNSKAFFNYDANLTSLITLELKFIFCLCDVGFSAWRH